MDTLFRPAELPLACDHQAYDYRAIIARFQVVVRALPHSSIEVVQGRIRATSSVTLIPQRTIVSLAPGGVCMLVR